MPDRRDSTRRLALLLLSGLITGSASIGMMMTPATAIEQAAPRDPHGAHIAKAARRFGIPADWIRAVMRIESAGDVRAVSAKGARGLMQIMPTTWAELRAQLQLGSDPYNPRDNILAGTAYLRELHDRYGSPGFLAAYNAGPGRYEEHLAGRPLPADTRTYVAMLRPLIGGGPLAEIVPTALASPRALPRRWQDAPLFIGAGSAAPAPSEQRPAVMAERFSSRTHSAVAPQSNGLFAARPGERTTP
ncbi:Transglycosylase SLT domain-containing protein [Bosea sp. CRIB-10]|uniref:lytic transglycosylase domain-containing protein n=1 Tax=Bosea sp. CRIB-10 TaxID=378404 RepID=UPI0008EF87EE|nr:lytic transglycosylase domain-containing protein [Bosea sp. CRIB-10]SFD71577.1 Transglycosylase SLT domain-containing protein [Bosea sp. CRIB-10]